MSVIAGLKDYRKQGPPADIGTFQMATTALVFQFTFSGTTYMVAMVSGVDSWTLLAQSAAGADQVEIQAAVDYLDGLGGGLLFIETPVNDYYDITVYVDFTGIDHVRVTGAQWNAVELRATAAMTHIFRITDGATDSSFLTFENIYFNGNANADTLIGVVAPNSCDVLVVDHCRFVDAIDMGVHNGNPTEVAGCVFTAIGGAGSDTAINIDGGYAWRIHDCIFSGNYVSITVEGASVAMIDNCQFYLDIVYSILINAATAETKITNIVIRGDNTTVTGIEDNGTGTVIQGFHIYNCATQAILVQGTDFTISDGFIDGNSLNTNFGIIAVGADLDGKITDVTIIECVGAIASPESTYVLVDGCVLTDNTHALNFWDTGIDYWTFGDNDFHGNTTGVCNNVTLIGVNCRLPTHTIPLTQGTTFISTADEAWGWEIDADTDFALGIGWLPVKVQQVVRIRVIGVALAAPGVGDYMRIQITGEGGTFGEGFATEPIDVVDKNNNAADPQIDEPIQWIFTPVDDADIGHLLGGDRLQLKILHEGAGNGDAETNAIVDSIQVEYI